MTDTRDRKQSQSDDDKESTLDRLQTFITVDELARIMRLNRDSVYGAIERGEIPGVLRIGRNIRVCREVVVEWLRGNGRGTRSKRRSA